jgi:tetratricopeptide (TPR) repeat protein
LLGEHLPSELLDLHLLRGKAFADYGQWDESGRAYRDALVFDDTCASAWLGVGRALLNMEVFEDAAVALGRVDTDGDSLDPSSRFELALALGRVAGAQHRFGDAVACFDRALAIQPARADVWFYKGVHLDLAGDRAASLLAYDASLEQNDAFAPAWFNRACQHAILGHRSAALSDLRRAVALDATWGPAALQDDYFRAFWDDDELKAVAGVSA